MAMLGRTGSMTPRLLVASALLSALLGLAAVEGASDPTASPTAVPTLSQSPAMTMSPTATCDSSDMSAKLSGTWYYGTDVQDKVDEIWDDTNDLYDVVYEKWTTEREMWDSEDEVYEALRAIECEMNGKNHSKTDGEPLSEEWCSPYWEENSAESKVNAIVIVAETYRTMIDVVAIVTGALFIYISKFGYLARLVGMVTPGSLKLTVVTDILASSIAVISWWSFGYGFAYGKDNYPDSGENGLYGGDNFMPMRINELSNKIGGGEETDESMIRHVEFLMHMGLAIICVGIPVGTLVERTTIKFTILSSLLLGILIYPVIVHVFWDENGWFSPFREKRLLYDCGVIDIAGSGVVHATGAVVALSASVILDSRWTRWILEEDAVQPRLMPKPQYSPAFEAFGATTVFICSLATTAFCVKRFSDDGAAVGRAMLNNLICSGVSALTSCVFGHYYTGVISPQLAGGGLIAGIATISSGCAVVTPEGAFVMGFFGGLAYYLGGALLVTIRVDDVSHAVSMHGFAGIIGLIMTGLFTDPVFYEQVFYDTRYYDSGCYGMFYNGGPTAVLTQSYGAMAIVAFAGTISTLVFGAYHLAIGGRFTDVMLEEGLDSARMGGTTRYECRAKYDDDKYAGILPEEDE